MPRSPILIRARIFADLVGRHPRGRTQNELSAYTLKTKLPASVIREILDGMIRDRLILRGIQERRKPLGPLTVYIADPRHVAREKST